MICSTPESLYSPIFGSKLIMVGKQSPWHLSFVYMSHASLPVQTALNFGKRTVPLKFYNLKFDTYAIICGVKIVSFSTNYFIMGSFEMR